MLKECDIFNVKDCNTSTSTLYNDYDVFEYSVCWKREHSITENEWNIKFFANKNLAQNFARKMKKESKIKPYPYIIQRVVSRNTFKKEVECEKCNIDFKSIYQRDDYRKFIKY